MRYRACAGIPLVSVAAGVLACVAAACADRSADLLVDSVTIRDTMMVDILEPSCSECTLEVTNVVRVGTPQDAEIPQRVPDVLRDSRGNLYLTFDGWSNRPILRYDSAGDYLGRLGEYGNGPGEYRMTFNAQIGSGDSVIVYDPSRRLQVFAPDGSFARSVANLPGPVIGIVPDTTRRLVLRGRNREEYETFSTFILVASRDGSAVDTIHAFTPGAFGNPRYDMAPDGSIWTLAGSYRLERIGLDGSTQQLLGLRPDAEFRTPIMTAAEADSLYRDLTSQIESSGGRPVRIAMGNPNTEFAVDSSGILWLLRTIRAPAADTITITKMYHAPDEAPGEATIPREQLDRLSHTIIEVVDPRTAQLLARIQLPFLGMLAAPGYVARVTEDDAGHYVTTVHKLTLRRPPPAR